MPYKSSLNNRFQASIKQVDELLAIHTFLMHAPTGPTDNILRAALTMLVSAIDTFVHELIINAILFEISEEKSIFDLRNINIPIGTIKAPSEEQRRIAIANHLRKQYGKESFQSSAKIESALSTIGITKVWKSISAHLNMSAEDIKLTLDLLVRRRNQIVHEGDLDHLHQPRDIFREDIDNSKIFCERFFIALYELYSNKLST